MRLGLHGQGSIYQKPIYGEVVIEHHRRWRAYLEWGASRYREQRGQVIGASCDKRLGTPGASVVLRGLEVDIDYSRKCLRSIAFPGIEDIPILKIGRAHV